MQKSTWTGGHTSSVLSLDVNREGILASGGEDELCIWSKDGTSQSKLPFTSHLSGDRDFNAAINVMPEGGTTG